MPSHSLLCTFIFVYFIARLEHVDFKEVRIFAEEVEDPLLVDTLNLLLGNGTCGVSSFFLLNYTLSRLQGARLPLAYQQ